MATGDKVFISIIDLICYFRSEAERLEMCFV